jgi:integrase
MARALNRLTAKKVEKLTKPGRHADGGGLYLSISRDGRRRWVFLYRQKETGRRGGGRLREIGLGSARDVSLAKARELASEVRVAVRDGRDPRHVRDADRRIPTFGEMAEEVVASLEPGWRNQKHRNQWRSTLETYCRSISTMPVDAITTEHVLGVLKPLWLRVPQTAARLRGRIERVLDAARAKGHRTGDNPARLRGNLNHLLPALPKLTRGHHKALPYREVPHFMSRLRERGSVSAMALEFAILTAARSGEVLGAGWDEIDVDQRVWIIPAERMKAGREHRVPLSDRAMEVMTRMAAIRVGYHVFPGAKPGCPLSTMALAMVLRRMQVPVTVHGFRSSFRDWAAEQTDFANEVAEMALAHAVSNEVERAYRRGDLFDKRRRLMEEWAAYCERYADVVPLEIKRGAA